MLGTQIGCQIWAVRLVAPDFPLELLQQFLGFVSSMTPSPNMLRRLRRMTSRWPSDYILFPKLKEHLSGTRFSSDSDMKRASENWFSLQ
ncbi:hypothetical protein AVEN_178381-1 [Araneus ventricosus]|uniref:Uncharacterized protein n=1 Tax=Araneus ventricosus TaxID=182803 RepID=A0A4Y2BCP2_ARAVE|nr:hypothetical protein AVEN_178381-1 [Araneus ventricosus]